MTYLKATLLLNALVLSSIVSAAPHTYSIGQHAKGGVVFWLDATKHHGLVVSAKDNTNTPVSWSNVPAITMGTQNWIDGGKINSALALAKMDTSIPSTSAIALCAAYEADSSGSSKCWKPTEGTPPTKNQSCYSDWYLPSIGELVLLAYAIQDHQEAFGTFTQEHYWSSTEFKDNPTGAWYMRHLNSDFSQQTMGKVNPDINLGVRCIRSF